MAKAKSVFIALVGVIVCLSHSAEAGFFDSMKRAVVNVANSVGNTVKDIGGTVFKGVSDAVRDGFADAKRNIAARGVPMRSTFMARGPDGSVGDFQHISDSLAHSLAQQHANDVALWSMALGRRLSEVADADGALADLAEKASEALGVLAQRAVSLKGHSPSMDKLLTALAEQAAVVQKDLEEASMEGKAGAAEAAAADQSENVFGGAELKEAVAKATAALHQLALEADDLHHKIPSDSLAMLAKESVEVEDDLAHAAELLMAELKREEAEDAYAEAELPRMLAAAAAPNAGAPAAAPNAGAPAAAPKTSLRTTTDKCRAIDCKACEADTGCTWCSSEQNTRDPDGLHRRRQLLSGTCVSNVAQCASTRMGTFNETLITLNAFMKNSTLTPSSYYQLYGYFAPRDPTLQPQCEAADITPRETTTYNTCKTCLPKHSWCHLKMEYHPSGVGKGGKVIDVWAGFCLPQGAEYGCQTPTGVEPKLNLTFEVFNVTDVTVCSAAFGVGHSAFAAVALAAAVAIGAM